MRSFVIALIVLCLSPDLAKAQGFRGAPPGRTKSPNGSPAPGTPGIVLPITPRSFGSWIDDATVAPARSTWISLSVTRWATPGARGFDAPGFDMAAGLSSRAQLTLSLPYSRYSTDEGESWSGLGNVYAGVKVVLARNALGTAGLSTTPLLEIESTGGSSTGADRVHLVLPVSIEAGGGPIRVYASTGYFTRGAVFASGALEARLSPRVALTGMVSHSRSTADEIDAQTLGLSLTRTDATGALSVFLTPNFAVFTSVGRTLSREEFDSARYAWNVGFTIGAGGTRQAPPRPPR